MSGETPNAASWAAALLASGGTVFGGATVQADAAEEFVAAFNAMAENPLRKVPAALTSDALTGSIDLAATLAAGEPVLTPGLLGRGEPARLFMRGAERLEPSVAALLAAAMDEQDLLLVAASDAAPGDPVLSPKLAERLSFRAEGEAQACWTKTEISKARGLAAILTITQEQIEALAEAALALGIASPRAVLQTLLAARHIAALRGNGRVDDDALALAAQLVLAHRAVSLPQDEPAPPPEAPPPEATPDADEQDQPAPNKAPPGDVILEAVKAALPPHLLQALSAGQGRKAAGRNDRTSAARKAAAQRGRKLGSRRTSALAGQRLDVIATLRAAAPWQVVRRRLAATGRMIVTRDDFHVARIKRRNMATAIFAVDASGSTALQRLAEAKGAVEAILAESYVRRDRVALIAFRNKVADVLLPPTRSLERARRALASLPGGGATPLAAGLDQSYFIAGQVRRAGGHPVIVVLTDGRGNMTRAGKPDKAIAAEETKGAARQIAFAGFKSMVIDVSPEPHRQAKVLAADMGAAYLAMPRADARDIAKPVSLALHSIAG